MIIQWYGQSCFRIVTRWTPPGSLQSEETVFVIDPFSKAIGLRPPSGRTDVVLVTHDHSDHNHIEAVLRHAQDKIGGEPFVIKQPGEYDIKGSYIQGIESFHDNVGGKQRGLNIIYTLFDGDITICHLGDLGQDMLIEDQLERIGSVDICMIPVGGIYTIDGEGAQSIIQQIEPSIVIPMHYALPNLSVKLDKRDEFLKIMGAKGIEPLPKLTIKKKEINPEETKIILLDPQG